MLGTFGWTELLIILVIIVILFGGSRIAGLGGSLGKSIREFRTAMKEEDEEGGTAEGGAAAAAAASSGDAGENKAESAQADSSEDTAKKS